MIPISITRRATIGLIASTAVPPRAVLAKAPARPDWALFKSAFVTAEGRVVDTNVPWAHSEAQAYGLLLAETHADRPTFERILAWTRAHLLVRPDRLMAWKYQIWPHSGVADMNNATDADLLAGWALLRASRRWGVPEWHMAASGIATDILSVCVRRISNRILLLPGSWGFEHGAPLMLNPSYYVFPALDAFASAFPNPVWRLLTAEGERVVSEARFGQFALPSDWARIDARTGRLTAADGPRHRFGYDAVRVPLYLLWGGRSATDAFTACSAFWKAVPCVARPAWVDLATGHFAARIAGPGTQLIASAVSKEPLRSSPGSWNGYYDTVLALLLDCAARDT